jgi:hypothetical protein
MTPDAKAQLIRAYRAACTAADTARSVANAVLEALLGGPPANQRATANHLQRVLETQGEADGVCAALEAQLRQADTRIRTFPNWADYGTPAWRWLLTTIEQESSQAAML